MLKVTKVMANRTIQDYLEHQEAISRKLTQKLGDKYHDSVKILVKNIYNTPDIQEAFLNFDPACESYFLDYSPNFQKGGLYSLEAALSDIGSEKFVHFYLGYDLPNLNRLERLSKEIWNYLQSFDFLVTDYSTEFNELLYSLGGESSISCFGPNFKRSIPHRLERDIFSEFEDTKSKNLNSEHEILFFDFDLHETIEKIKKWKQRVLKVVKFGDSCLESKISYFEKSYELMVTSELDTKSLLRLNHYFSQCRFSSPKPWSFVDSLWEVQLEMKKKYRDLIVRNFNHKSQLVDPGSLRKYFLDTPENHNYHSLNGSGLLWFLQRVSIDGIENTVSNLSSIGFFHREGSNFYNHMLTRNFRIQGEKVIYLGRTYDRLNSRQLAIIKYLYAHKKPRTQDEIRRALPLSSRPNDHDFYRHGIKDLLSSRESGIGRKKSYSLKIHES